MTPEERQAMTLRVTAEIEKTRQAIAVQAVDNRGIAPDRAIGRVSRMDAMYNQQVNAGTLRRSRERLSKLEHILNQIDTPGFGLCEICRAPIPLARLNAMPESTTCMRCAATR